MDNLLNKINLVANVTSVFGGLALLVTIFTDKEVE